jgi:saccharopine dehydrogenase-like NADP-dependent oxidoreductase
MKKAKQESVLIIGGSGIVGSLTAKTLRKLHPEQPITIGGRDMAKANAVARELGNADAIRIDLERADLGLPAERTFSAIVMFVKDATLNALRYAQEKRTAYVDISTVGFELAPEIALFARKPKAAPIVLGSQWLAGASLLPALHFAKAYSKLESIAIGAVLDEQDMGGPAAFADYERITKVVAGSQIMKGGKWVWVDGEAAARTFENVDGTEVQATAYSVLDNLSLAATTSARDIRFDVVVGTSAARKRGEHFSTEYVIELEGIKTDGTRGRSRHEFVHPEGQAPVTALGTAVIVERVLGLEGEAVPAGLHMPDTFIDPTHMIDRLTAFGAQFRSL